MLDCMLSSLEWKLQDVVNALRSHGSQGRASTLSLQQKGLSIHQGLFMHFFLLTFLDRRLYKTINMECSCHFAHSFGLSLGLTSSSEAAKLDIS